MLAGCGVNTDILTLLYSPDREQVELRMAISSVTGELVHCQLTVPREVLRN